MRSLVRNFLKNTFSLWLVTLILSIITPFTFANIIIASITLTIADLLLKPILSLLFLPLSAITFNLLGWLPTTLTIYSVSLFLQSFVIKPFSTPNMSFGSLIIPQFHFGTFTSIIAVSLLIEIIRKTLDWAFTKEG